MAINYRQIIAKFPGTCPNCKHGIEPGTKVLWAPGRKAQHVECAAAVKSPELRAEQARYIERGNGTCDGFDPTEVWEDPEAELIRDEILAAGKDPADYGW